MQRRLNELVDYLDAQRSALLRVASTLPADRWSERPAPDRWSVVELLEHLSKVEHSCARVVAKRAAEVRAEGHPAELATGSVLGALDSRALTDRSSRMTSPERVAPAGGLSRVQALADLAASRAEMMQAIGIADGLALETVTCPHARLGDLNLYQWILFLGQHEERHLAQLAEITEQLAPAAR